MRNRWLGLALPQSRKRKTPSDKHIKKHHRRAISHRRRRTGAGISELKNLNITLGELTNYVNKWVAKVLFFSNIRKKMYICKIINSIKKHINT
jgi:hypothetical protein